MGLVQRVINLLSGAISERLQPGFDEGVALIGQSICLRARSDSVAQRAQAVITDREALIKS